MATQQTASGISNDDLPDPLIPTQGDDVPLSDADLDDDEDLVATDNDNELDEADDAADADDVDDLDDEEEDEDEDEENEAVTEA